MNPMASRKHGMVYVAPAPPLDTLFEQLEYLTTHDRGTCLPLCSACCRMKMVRELLLSPFTDLRAPSAN